MGLFDKKKRIPLGDSFIKKTKKDNVVPSIFVKFKDSFTSLFKGGKSGKVLAKGEIFVRDFIGGTINRNQPGKLLVENIVTLDASVLLARLMKDPTDPAAGVAYFALGLGDDGTWDLFNPPAPTDDTEELVSEIERVAVTRAVFIDPNTGLETTTPTKIVDFDFDVTEAQAVGRLVECGLVGGDATATANSGTLITYRTFGVISKSSTMVLSFTYRLTF